MNLRTGKSCPRKKRFCSLTGSLNGVGDRFLNLAVQTLQLECMDASHLTWKLKSLFDLSAFRVCDWLVSTRLVWFEPALHFFCPTFCTHAHFSKPCTCYICLRVATLIFPVILFSALHIADFFLFSTSGPITRRCTQEQPVWARLIICAREHGRPSSQAQPAGLPKVLQRTHNHFIYSDAWMRKSAVNRC